jgi:hypothetical protein
MANRVIQARHTVIDSRYEHLANGACLKWKDKVVQVGIRGSIKGPITIP